MTHPYCKKQYFPFFGMKMLSDCLCKNVWSNFKQFFFVYISPSSIALFMSETSLSRISLYSELGLKTASRNSGSEKKLKTASILRRDFSVRCLSTSCLIAWWDSWRAVFKQWRSQEKSTSLKLMTAIAAAWNLFLNLSANRSSSWLNCPFLQSTPILITIFMIFLISFSDSFLLSVWKQIIYYEEYN